VSDQDAKNSDFVEVIKRNGDFRKNYGLIIGAVLFLRSISAARRGLFWWRGMLFAAVSALALLQRTGWLL
jgi:hypothetical protein